MNHYALWKYILIVVIVGVSTLYALPNLFGEDPAIQISPAYAHNVAVDDALQQKVQSMLADKNIIAKNSEYNEQQLLLRFTNTDVQLKAYSLLKKELKGFSVAQNLAPSTPEWLRDLGALPMYLGLDLRGGVHFLMEVDMESAIRQDEERYVQEFRALFRDHKLRNKSLVRLPKGGIQVLFDDKAKIEQGKNLLSSQYPDLVIEEVTTSEGVGLLLHYSEAALKEAKSTAVEQNTTTLRNRVNELGVAEPVIQRQGEDRIVVQLPGVQDTVRAKEILGATATLEFRLTYEDSNQWDMAQSTGHVPPNARLYHTRDGRPVLLQRTVIATGDQINKADSTIDQQQGQPAVSVRLDGKGAKRMYDTTKKNVGKPMAVVFIEHKVETKTVEGKEVKTRRIIEEVINIASIREAFGQNFQITGLELKEANNLALLLRAGALKAPVEIVEERTIGPSLGADNVAQGFYSILVGFLAVMIFMAWRYKQFGLIANAVLLLNVIILVALLSMLQATLTLPGIAGILLTIGMAVDANVLIYERIREELHNGNTPQNSIHSGYAKAFGTIADSNITTLIAGIVLFSFGTGPVKGFAVTLSLGIMTSMFTAVMISRAIVNALYGNKRLKSLSI